MFYVRSKTDSSSSSLGPITRRSFLRDAFPREDAQATFPRARHVIGPQPKNCQEASLVYRTYQTKKDRKS